MIGTIIGFIGGFLTALFAEPLRQWLFQPILSLEFNNTSHFVTKTWKAFESSRHEAHYARIKVTNTRRSLARSCRAYLVNIERIGPSGAWEATDYCESMQLAWSGRGGDAYTALDLPKDVPHFVDLLSTRQGSKSFDLAIQLKLFRHEALLVSAGTYRLTIVVSGDGVRPEWIWLSFTWSGDWDGFKLAVAEPRPALVADGGDATLSRRTNGL